MVTILLKSKILLILGLLYHSGLFASTSAKDWYQSIQQSGFSYQLSPHRILFVRWLESKNEYQVMPIDTGRFNSFGYLDLIEERDLRYYKTINHNVVEGLSLDDFIERSFNTTYADTIVVEVDGNPRWNIYHRTQDSKIQRVFRGRGPDQIDAITVHRWFLDKLGYSAVVLQRYNNFFLVANFDNSQNLKQALALESEAEQIIVPTAKRAGLALIQHVDTFGDVSIFESLLLKDGLDIRPGTKLLVPRSNE